MKRYTLTPELRATLVDALTQYEIFHRPSVDQLLRFGFRGFANLADHELVECAIERELDLPHGIDESDVDANRSYRVTWSIDIEEAVDPRHAAERARAHQHPATTAVVFECADTSTGETTDVDLLEGEDQAVISCMISAKSMEVMAGVYPAGLTH